MPGRASSRSKPSMGWTIEGLPADRPVREFGDELRLFGQFVGHWHITEIRFPPAPSVGEGEIHFNWILEGRAVQDVWGTLDPKTRRFAPWGTTVRFYDPVLRAWRSTWISPRQKAVRRFIGRKVGREIVLQEEDRGVRTERWIFTDIRPDSFRWYALRRRRIFGTWQKVEEMRVERRGSRRKARTLR